MIHISQSEDATHAWGVTLGKALKGGEIITLSGPLGAGKTVLVRGMAQGLGVTSHVKSPTFTLMRIMEGKDGKSVCHIDCYRMEEGALSPVQEWSEWLGHKNVVSIIEWPERLGSFLQNYKVLAFQVEYGTNENERRIIYEQ